MDASDVSGFNELWYYILRTVWMHSPDCRVGLLAWFCSCRCWLRQLISDGLPGRATTCKLRCTVRRSGLQNHLRRERTYHSTRRIKQSYCCNKNRSISQLWILQINVLQPFFLFNSLLKYRSPKAISFHALSAYIAGIDTTVHTESISTLICT